MTNRGADHRFAGLSHLLAIGAIPIMMQPSTGPSIVNIPLASLSICVPGTTQCQTVSNLVIDTQSTGIRVYAAALTVPLPAVENGGAPVATCEVFVTEAAWGAVKSASVVWGQEPPVTVPIQVVGDPTVGTAPSSSGCSSNNSTAGASPGTNGILGTSDIQFDSGNYFACQNGSCTSSGGTISPIPSYILQNPVFSLQNDKNGIILSLMAIPDQGLSSSTPVQVGTLYAGIGTDPDGFSLSGEWSVMGPSADIFNTTYNGTPPLQSFLDSGSNVLLFNDPSIQLCPANLASVLSSRSDYCPTPSALELSATLSDYLLPPTGAPHTAAITFEIANPGSASQAGTNIIALDNLGSTWQGLGQFGWDWGLPFFFNRAVFISYSQTTFGAAHSWGYRYLSQPPPMFDTVEMSLATGGDNAGSGVEITGKLTIEGETVDVCLKPSTSTGAWLDPICNQSNLPNSWGSGFLTTVVANTSLAQTLAGHAGSLTISLRQPGCQTFCDNWNLQGITVAIQKSATLRGSKQSLVLLDIPASPNNNNCIARLKVSPNATQVKFNLNGSATTGQYVDGTTQEKGEVATCQNNGG
jgi:Protein of unknown function (DUF3443)